MKTGMGTFTKTFQHVPVFIKISKNDNLYEGIYAFLHASQG
jgi:hypothetical protein